MMEHSSRSLADAQKYDQYSGESSMKKIIYAIMSLFILAGAAAVPAVVSASPQALLTAAPATVTADILNIRDGSSLEHTVVAKLARGSAVTVLAVDGDWYIVRLQNGKTGWAFSDYVSMSQPLKSTAGAENVPGSGLGQFYRLTYNGAEISFPDAQPFMDSQSRALVPVRFLAELMNFEVKWADQGGVSTIILVRDGLQVELALGGTAAVVNGTERSLDAGAVMINKRTYVPLRFMSELAEVQVAWDAATNTVALTSKATTVKQQQDAVPAGTWSILSAPRAGVDQAKAWARAKGASELFVDLADVVWSEAAAAGVDPLLVYAQAAKETGYGKFGGVLDASFMNTSGLKTNNGGADNEQSAHQRFDSWQAGVQAQVDHLALYAGAPGYPKANSNDPRHFPYLLGVATTVEQLGAKWAISPTYGLEIVRMMTEVIEG